MNAHEPLNVAGVALTFFGNPFWMYALGSTIDWWNRNAEK